MLGDFTSSQEEEMTLWSSGRPRGSGMWRHRPNALTFADLRGPKQQPPQTEFKPEQVQAAAAGVPLRARGPRVEPQSHNITTCNHGNGCNSLAKSAAYRHQRRAKTGIILVLLHTHP